MASPFKYSEEIRNKAIEMYRNGVAIKIIAYECGMCESNVVNLASKAGIRARNYKGTKEYKKNRRKYGSSNEIIKQTTS